MAWEQFRQVEIGRQLYGPDFDTEIEVAYDDDGHRFEVSLYNLTDDSAEQLDQGVPVRIKLGWANDVSSAVLVGLIETVTREYDDGDVIHTIKGADESEYQVRRSFSKSWTAGETPSKIARDIADECYLDVGAITPVETAVDDPLSSVQEDLGIQIFERSFVATRDKPARHWLDKLVKMTENATDEAWEWFVDGGRLYFVRQDNRHERTIELSFDNTLLEIGPAESDDSEAKNLEFTAMMEPMLRASSPVYVDTADYQGAYKLTEYTMTSETTSGEHVVTGTLSPLDVEYSTYGSKQAASWQEVDENPPESSFEVEGRSPILDLFGRDE